MTRVLVVSTYSYEKLESYLDILVKKYPERQFEFYIVNETYGRKPPENTKYSNYVSINDSSNEEDISKVLNHVCKWPMCEITIQSDEYAITLLAIINARLGLIGLTQEQEQSFRDKVRMKQLLGIDVCKPRLYSKQQILDNLVSYPVVVKPRTFAASRGVYVVCSKEELLDSIKDKKFDYNRASVDTIDDVEVEEYIDSDTYHIDGLVSNGQIVFCTASKYIGSCLSYAQGKILGSISLPISRQEEALSFAKKVHRDLVIPNGAFHLECFYRSEEFVFLEIGVRPGGAEIVPTIEAGTGINLIEEHLKYQLGIESDIKIEKFRHFGWVNLPYKYDHDSPRYVKSIVLPSVNTNSIYSSSIPHIGEKATADFVDYSRSLGHFVFRSECPEELEKDIYIYIREYQVEVE